MDDETRLSSSEEPTILSGSSDHATVLSSSSAWSSRGSHASAAAGGDGLRLADGQAFGPYTIVRLLGRGGMGEVYEATHDVSGRRVALKLLRGRLDFGPERLRFLQEGRLAASLSHPHTVYVLGSDEIDGLPVIAMQLVPGGTLKDRVAERGPMTVSDAVAAVLDVISGLDAAASAGILHRDIKPSNCFIDANGAVKVGDFGLSISTAAAERQGGFQGTPQFAPPEQFSGATLDTRADIYAVGATLFYLLTGRAPFDGSDVTELIERVKQDPPPLAHTVQAGVPAALSTVIARCLSKDPAARPSSYPELVTALRPFSATSAPARPGLRIVSWAIDSALIGAVSGLVGSVFAWGHASTVARSAGRGEVSVNVDPIPVVVGVLYYALIECRTGASIGKRLLGLRVISVAGERTWAQLFKRTLIFFGGNALNVIGAVAVGPNRLAQFAAERAWAAAVVSAGPMVGMAVQLVPMRRRNGFTGLHDWLTGTRVVQNQREELRRRDEGLVAPSSAPLTGSGRRTLGPFSVHGELASWPSGRLLEAMDPVLKRRVWIVERDADAPDTTRARREVDRVGRLHWLAGHRDAGECWDAYEAPEGAPLDTRPSSAPWSRARLWLSDLAAELAASARDATTPVLALDRVWVRPDGRAVLLDWPAPGATGSPADLAAVPLLESIGRLAMGYEHATPVPVSAVTMLDRWRKRPQLGLDELQSDLVAVSLSPAEVSRTRRLLPLAANATLTVFGVIAAVITLFLTKKAGDPSLPATLVFVCASVSFGGAVMSVLVRPSGLVMSALGLAVLTRDGREIGRIRAVWRLLVAWSPVACYAALCTPMSLRSFVMTPVPAFGVIALLLAGVIWTALRPTRGPHDRICGTQIGVR